MLTKDRLERRLVMDVVKAYTYVELEKLGTVRALMADLLKLEEENTRYQRLLIEFDDEPDGCMCSVRQRLFVMGERLESDSEYAQRIEREADHAIKAENFDRRRYEELRKRFDPK